MSTQKRTHIVNVRFTEDERKTIELAAKVGDTLKSRIIVESALKEANRILKEIEKGDY